MSQDNTIRVGGREIKAGERAIVDLPVADLYTHTQLMMPVHVVNGRRPGPTLFITGALHGDELNGVEIVRRVINGPALKGLRGCLLAAPIVNVFGFINRSRYLPDRRDLNRSFPGREKGSIAARLAYLVAQEIVAHADFGIDLHTGAIDRANLPQIRADLSDPQVLRIAEAFATPVIIDANAREGTLRQFAAEKGVRVLVYEGGEALRFDELSIRAGVRGIRRVLRALDMLPQRAGPRAELGPTRANTTSWIRAPSSGIIRTECRLGERVKAGQILGVVSDPFGEVEVEVEVPDSGSGIVIGRSTSPLTHEGDALFHIARFEDNKEAKASVDEFQEAHSVTPTWG